MSQPIESLQELIPNWNQVVIIPHLRPDGDAMGSSLALYHYFTNKGIQSVVIAPTYYPEFLHWLPGNDKVWQFLQKQPQTTSVIKKADAVFCMDFNSLTRIDRMAQIVENNSKLIVNIDHHLDPTHFGDYELINPKVSSTSELVYDFICTMGDQHEITTDIATCIYTGILTDTGGFNHSNTTAITHKIAGDLMERGVNIEEVHHNLYNNSSANRLQFLGHTLLNRTKFYPFYNAAMIYVTKEDAEKYELQSGDTEGLVNYPLSVNGVRFSTLIKEDDPFVKMSFRSNQGFEVNEFAKKHFDGGGHVQAAGGKSELSLEQTIKKFEKILPTYKEELNK